MTKTEKRNKKDAGEHLPKRRKKGKKNGRHRPKPITPRKEANPEHF